MNFDVGVVIPAAGIGERFGSNMPKQYCHLLHRPLLLYTIECFLKHPWIKNIVIVTSKVSIEETLKHMSKYSQEELKKLHVTVGGSSRHKSIYLGLQALQELNTSVEVVVIHDGVRPFVPEKILKEVTEAAKLYGAAGVVRALVSTVISKNEENFLENVLDRTKYYASEMPQAFNFKIILEAYNKCDEHVLEVGTECLQIAQIYGNTKPKLIISDHDLWKVTHRKDLYATEGILKENKPVLIFTDGIDECFLQCLKNVLSRRFQHVKMISKQQIENSFSNTNIVKFHTNKPLKNVVEEELKNTIFIGNSIVHVICSKCRIEEHNDVYTIARKCATMLRNYNSCIYYVCVEKKDLTSENNYSVCEMIEDMLFNNSLALSGQILFV